MISIGRSERLLRTFLPYYLGMLLVMTIIGSAVNYYDHHNWKMGDWLINYQGGFVRRGFLGEAFLCLSQATSWNLGIFVVLFQSVFYFIYFCFAYLLLKRVALVKYAILIVSPFIFTFQLNDFQGGYRKEIIYFAIVSFLGYAKVTYRRERFEKVFFATLLIYALAILSHEMLIVFIPYLIALYALDNALSTRTWFLISIFSLPFLAAFSLCACFTGTVAQEHQIFTVLAGMNYHIDGGAITRLHHTIHDGMRIVSANLAASVSYIAVIALSLVAFLPVSATIRNLFKSRPIVILVALSVLGTMAVSVIALDWGRFIYMHLVSLFILLLVSERTIAESEGKPEDAKLPGLLVGGVLVWSMVFHIPHFYEENMIARKISQINAMNYAVKPICRLYQIRQNNPSALRRHEKEMLPADR